MFEIINQTINQSIGFTDNPRYIYLSPNGSYVQCDEQIAQGIAYKSTPYNLLGREPLNAEIDTVFLREIDTGKILWDLKQEVDALSNTLTTED